ncbi:hypothetical protein VTI74DRAFT_976 [Chaetomium olivicolor]
MNHQPLALRPHTPPLFDSSSRSLLQDISNNVSFGEDIDFVVGVTATVLAADQLLKLKDSKKHQRAHLAKAGLSVATAAAAFYQMKRECRERHHHISSRRDRQRQRSADSDTDSGWESDPPARDPKSPGRHGDLSHAERKPRESWAIVPSPRHETYSSYHQPTSYPVDNDRDQSGRLFEHLSARCPPPERRARSVSLPAHHHYRRDPHD